MSDTEQRLHALYERLPTIECKGLCHQSCGPIMCSTAERELMEEAAGHPLGVNGITCNMLVDGRCSVYAQRPIICRAWGVVQGMPCEFGCKATLMPDTEAAELIAASIEIGGPICHSAPGVTEFLLDLRNQLDG